MIVLRVNLGNLRVLLVRRFRATLPVATVAGSLLLTSWARDVKITIPRRSELTPVQRLNREGVEAICKKQYGKAEALFYKAYLYDPADPFTLNNLGYVSELQGRLDRAQEFYALASEQGSQAQVDRSSDKQLQGKSISYALGGLKDSPMRVNRMNVQAIELLSEGRGLEANAVLERALSLDPHNVFTLNNLGVANEAIGNYEGALKYYREASDLSSKEPIVVTLNRSWRGKPVSEMAEDSFRRLTSRLQKMDNSEARAAMLTWRGVAAVNRNDWISARQAFMEAYSLNPRSAFSLNNIGYVAERDGDLETAEFYYEKARTADNANARIGLATQVVAEGKHLSSVAGDNDQKVDSKLATYTEAQHGQSGPIELKRRDNRPAPPEESPGNTPDIQSPPSELSPPQQPQ
jgi:Flp pilus assembly protein TadD